MNEQYAELITGFPLFAGFTVNGTKRLLDAGEVKEHGSGSVLLKEGDAATFVLLVLAGRLAASCARICAPGTLSMGTPRVVRSAYSSQSSDKELTVQPCAASTPDPTHIPALSGTLTPARVFRTYARP